jgi:tetratricopeptide (TPR) repeat protein
MTGLRKIHPVFWVALATLVLGFLALASCVGSEGQQKVQEANRLLAEDHLDQALVAYREAQEIEPDLADAYYGEGLVLYHRKLHAEAESPFRKAAELDSDEPMYYLYLGRVLGRMQRLEEAEAAFLETTRLAPIEPEGWKGLGLTLYNMGRGPEARAALEKYLSFARDASDRAAIQQLVHVLPEAPPSDS